MLVFRSVTLSLASMANVSIVVGLFFLIFAIMGVQLFGGRFWTCNDTSVADKVWDTPLSMTCTSVLMLLFPHAERQMVFMTIEVILCMLVICVNIGSTACRPTDPADLVSTSGQKYTHKFAHALHI